MKQMPRHETLYSSLRWVLAGLVLVSVAAAQTFDTAPPTISHQPVKLARLGKPLAIVALIGDKSGVREVVVRASHAGQPYEVPMAAMGEGESVPLKIRVVARDLDVLSGPGSAYKKVAVLAAGEVAGVTQVRDGYGRIRSDAGLVGYVELSGCEAVETGAAYRVALPVEMTGGGSVSYQIFAMDNFGNESQTEMIDVRLIDDLQLAQMQAQAGLGGQETKATGKKSLRRGKPFYTSPWFWLAAAAAGGGAYYVFSGDDSGQKSNKATVNVIIGW